MAVTGHLSIHPSWVSGDWAVSQGTPWPHSKSVVVIAIILLNLEQSYENSITVQTVGEGEEKKDTKRIVGKQIHRSAQYLIYINSDGKKNRQK